MVSSANITELNTSELAEGNSFTLMLKNNGLEIDPCGTPELMFTNSNRMVANIPYCSLSVK